MAKQERKKRSHGKVVSLHPEMDNEAELQKRFRYELHLRRQAILAKAFVAMSEIDYELRAWRGELR